MKIWKLFDFMITGKERKKEEEKTIWLTGKSNFPLGGEWKENIIRK